MNFILFLLLLSLSMVWMKGRNHPQGRLCLGILAGLSLVTGVVKIVRPPESATRLNELRVQESCGYMLGKAAMRAFPEGGVFAVLNMPTFSSRVTPTDAKMKGLKSAFKGQPYELVELDLGLLPMDLKSFFSHLENRVPVPEFWQQVQQVPGHTALISLVGLPPPPERSEIPLFIAGASDVETMRNQPRWQGIQAAVKMKSGLVLRNLENQKGDMEDIFKSRYELIEFD
ncbi:hypothetical protein P0Y35_09825 [Kiritimatiellaeota bacterium B1221]|nr:hypothetical protein [Kiritimatiellaeota bacterium B1221]